MIAVSYGLYAPYWIYRNWRFVKERNREHMWPFWRGIFGIFWIYPLLVQVRDSAKGRERDVGSLSAGALAVGFIVCTVLASLLSLNERPGMAFLATLLGFAGYCFLIPAQIHVNRLHAYLGVAAPPYPFSAGHVVCVILGLILWFMSLVSLFDRGWY